MINISNKQSGFTAIELLITLFIAAMFLASGFQLYSVVIKSGGETRVQANASNIMYEYLQRYKNTTSDLCTAQTPVTDQPVTVTGSATSTVTVVITCPYGITSPISKVSVSVKYGNPQQTVSEATFIKPQNIVNDGLIMNLDAGNAKSFKGRRSAINWDSWTVGTGAVTGYGLNGDGNSRLIDTNPWGASDIVWDVSGQDATSDDDGGWQGTSFSIDNTKMYRFTTWVRRKTIGNGVFYLGTSGGGASVLNRSAGAVDGNPYFSATGWWGNVNQWYLVVGYVWPAGSGTGAAMPNSGIFALDGTKVASNSDFVWQPTTTTSNHRSYLYYSTDTTTNQQWYQPRVDVVDGTEPTITELINNAGNIWTDLSGNSYNGTLSRGVSYNTNNNGILNFDGVSGYAQLPNNIVPTSNIRSTGVTYSVWAKTVNTATEQRLVGQKPDSGYSDFASGGLGISGGKAKMISYDDSGAYKSTIGNTPLQNNTWYFITGTYDPSDKLIRIYVNGVLDGTTVSITTFSRLVANGDNTIGKQDAGLPYFFNGSIGNIQIYNRTLNTSEIQQNFNALHNRYGI